MRSLILCFLISCYNPPQPACGFLCGPNAACPDGYACNADDGYCHLGGTSGSCAPDAGVDAFDFFPIIATLDPVDHSTDVPLDVTPTVKFTEQVTGVSATSFTLTPRAGGDPIAATVTYNTATRTASLDPDALLANSTVYDAALGPDIVDLAGKALVGQTRWAFATVADTTPPTVTSKSPADHATGVAVDTPIIATFSEQVSHVTAGSFLLDAPAGPVPGAIGFVSVTATSFTPASQLAPATLYRVTLTSAITDMADHALAPVTWTFTTGADAIAPEILLRIPDVDDTEVPLDSIVTVGFSEPVVGVSTASITLEQGGLPIAATVLYDDPGRLARLTPSAALVPNAVYTITLSTAITDGSGNLLAGPTIWSFTTTASPI